MTKTDIAEAAAVLNALTQDWALVDQDPEIDFLLFVSESRDELDFYPKKSFITMMEQSGLIENPDKERSSVRKTMTHYEGGASGWKQVTIAEPIVYRYQVTQEGQRLLRDAPRLTGRPVRKLRSARSPIDVQSKPLKVVTYDRAAIEQLVKAWDQKATVLIEAAFSPKDDLDHARAISTSLVCGPRLWSTLEPHAKRNGLQPSGSLLSVTYDLIGKGDKESPKRLEDRPIQPGNEARLFWLTLREVFKLDGPLAVRTASSAERSAYTFPGQIENMYLPENDFPSPDLSNRSVSFVVEGNKSRFMVLVNNVPTSNMESFEPQVSWVELMPLEK